MIIEPYGERLIVKRLAESETRKSGIILPESVKDRSLIGRVVHCGPDAIHVQESDIIFFANTPASCCRQKTNLLTAKDMLIV